MIWCVAGSLTRCLQRKDEGVHDQFWQECWWKNWAVRGQNNLNTDTCAVSHSVMTCMHLLSTPAIGRSLCFLMPKMSHNPLLSDLQLAQILPTEENFLLCFREFVGSSAEFMAVSLYIHVFFDLIYALWHAVHYITLYITSALSGLIQFSGCKEYELVLSSQLLLKF